MGMDQKVVFAPERAPAWPRVRELLAGRGLAVQLRMIDGQLAFPDEEPTNDWTEVRVGTADGMVTLRREGDGVRLVVWGNADAGLCRTWNLLTWAWATLSDGRIDTAGTSRDVDEFCRSAGLE